MEAVLVPALVVAVGLMLGWRWLPRRARVRYRADTLRLEQAWWVISLSGLALLLGMSGAIYTAWLFALYGTWLELAFGLGVIALYLYLFVYLYVLGRGGSERAIIFDRRRDRITRGTRFLGRPSNVAAVRVQAEKRSAVSLVWKSPNGYPPESSLPGPDRRSAEQVAHALADYLLVPNVGPGQSVPAGLSREQGERSAPARSGRQGRPLPATSATGHRSRWPPRLLAVVLLLGLLMAAKRKSREGHRTVA